MIYKIQEHSVKENISKRYKVMNLQKQLQNTLFRKKNQSSPKLPRDFCMTKVHAKLSLLSPTMFIRPTSWNYTYWLSFCHSCPLSLQWGLGAKFAPWQSRVNSNAKQILTSSWFGRSWAPKSLLTQVRRKYATNILLLLFPVLTWIW